MTLAITPPPTDIDPVIAEAALQWLRDAARDQLYPGGTLDPIVVRRLVTLDGNLADGEAMSRCICGGLLTLIDLRWMHIDRCNNCRNDKTRCDETDRAQHTMCIEPHPRQCIHDHCIRFVDLTAEPCKHGEEDCEGCCHGEDTWVDK